MAVTLRGNVLVSGRPSPSPTSTLPSLEPPPPPHFVSGGDGGPSASGPADRLQLVSLVSTCLALEPCPGAATAFGRSASLRGPLGGVELAGGRRLQ